MKIVCEFRRIEAEKVACGLGFFGGSPLLGQCLACIAADGAKKHLAGLPLNVRVPPKTKDHARMIVRNKDRSCKGCIPKVV